MCAELRRRGRRVNHKRVERLTKRHHLPGFVPHKLAVRHLLRHGPTSASDPGLLERLEVSRAQATQVLRRLEDAEFVYAFQDRGRSAVPESCTQLVSATRRLEFPPWAGHLVYAAV